MSNESSSKFWLPVLGAAAGATFVAVLGATMTDLSSWYQGLTKPDWQPPDWLFGPAWTIIFALAALSAALAWRDATKSSNREWLIGLFALNGFLNVLWSFLFFRLQRPDWALYDSGLLWLSIILLMVFVFRMSRLGALLLVPYLIWVSIATVLNYRVIELNGPF